jgi:hypothetical protein
MAETSTLTLPNIKISPLWSRHNKWIAASGEGTYALTEFSDNYTSNYNMVNTFGRMDPLVSYSNTSREVNFGLLFEGDEGSNAEIGIDFAQKIARFQYPEYHNLNDSIPNALLIKRPPLVFVSAPGLLAADAEGDPILCVMKSFAFTPTVGLTPLTAPVIGLDFRGNKTVNFQSITVRFSFTVLHAESKGWILSGDKYRFLGGL